MIDPRTVMIAIPCYDGRNMAEITGMLHACQGMFVGLSLPSECSHVGLVRNLIAGQFMSSSYEWLVCIDSDIVFRREDLELLLEPCDMEQDYTDDLSPQDEVRLSLPPRPTRLPVAQSADIRNLDSKTVSAADALVCAEYSLKNDTLEPAKLGMGFVRIHRSVFRTLEALKHDGGPTIEVSRELFETLNKVANPLESLAPVRSVNIELVRELIKSADDKAGQPRLWQTQWKGRMYYDYFPSGPIQSQFVPTAEWKGEDHGFFTLCMLAGIVPRIETRTRLLHIGRKAYPYFGPDQGSGQ
jgi:hypothetical protein